MVGSVGEDEVKQVFVAGGCFDCFGKLEGLCYFVEAPAGGSRVRVREVEPTPFVHIEVAEKVSCSVVGREGVEFVFQ